MTSANIDSSVPETIAAVALRLPPFWTADPQLWFLQVEAQFATQRVTADRLRYYHIISSLPPDVAAEVRDLLLHPPEQDAYATLKRSLIQRTTASEGARFQQLLTEEELGDRKPSQLLRHMQRLLGEKATSIDASLLRNLFLQRLPGNVRMVLVSAGDLTIEKLAELADKVAEVSTPSISAVKSPPVSSDLQLLREELSHLTDAVASLKLQASRERGRSQSRSRSTHGRHASPARGPEVLCWYHRRFGDAATKCTRPCSHPGNARGEH